MTSLIWLWACTTPENEVSDRQQDADPPVEEAAPVDDADDAGDQPAEEHDDEPSDYVYEDAGSDDEVLSLGAIEEALTRTFDAMLLFDPETLTTTYYELMEEGEDADCPYFYDYYTGYDYWYDSCTSDVGSVYSGYGYSYRYEPYTSGYYFYDDQAYLAGYGSITDRTGETVELAGSWYHYTYRLTYDDTWYGYASWAGDARYSGGDRAEGTWIEDSYSLDLVATYVWDMALGHSLTLEGAVTGFDLSTDSAVFENFAISSEGLGSACEAEAGGSVSLRDPATGDWYEVLFDGAPYSGGAVFPPDCDGCGTAWLGADELGEVCPDFSALFSWEHRPWN